MKKKIISLFVIIVSIFVGIYVYHELTYEKTNYNFIAFNDIPQTIQDKKKVIIFFTQEGCPTCKLVEPIINEYAKANKGTVFAIITNKEKNYYKEATKYQIKGTPTLIYYNNGKEVYRSTTGFTESEFKQVIKDKGF